MHKAVQAELSYVMAPTAGKMLGYNVDLAKERSGLPAFSFKRQHGSWPLAREAVDTARFMRNSVVPRPQIVNDARTSLVNPTLGSVGFQLVTLYCARDVLLSDDRYVEREYYSSLCDLLREKTGAGVVLPYDFVRRNAAESKPEGQGPPAFLAHTDSADRSWPWRIDEFLETGEWAQVGPANVDEAFARKFLSRGKKWMIVNCWRHLCDSEILSSTPLALCDDASVDWENDVMRYAITMQGTVAFNYVLKHSPHHKWYYFSNMKRSDLLLFKAFSASERDTNTGHTKKSALFHTAFGMPPSESPSHSPPDPRKSLEVRCILADFDE